MTAVRQPSAPQRRHRRQHRRGAGHVHLHGCVHRVARLEADAARVVHHALADHREVAGGSRRAVRQLDHPRRLGAAGVDAEQPAAAERRELVGVEDLDLEPGRRGDGDRHVGHPAGRQVAGGVLARSRASWAASAMTRPRSMPPARWPPRATPARRAPARPARCRWPPSSAPSSGSGRAARPRRRPAAAATASPSPASASVVARRSCLPAALAKAAAASRRVAGVSSPGSPTPTATTVGPPRRGTTSVWPSLPSKPDAASVARSSPTDARHRPLHAHWDADRAGAVGDVARHRDGDRTGSLGGRRRVEGGDGRARHAESLPCPSIGSADRSGRSNVPGGPMMPPVACCVQWARSRTSTRSNERVVVFDGAFGTYVQGLDLTADDFGGPSPSRAATRCCASPGPTSSPACTPRSSTSASTPSRRRASAASARCSPSTTSPSEAHELNVAAARIAREVADDYAADGRSRYVAGSIGPGTKLPSLGHIGFAELRDAYEEQAAGLLEGGVDLFLVETCMDLLQVKAAMIACRRAMRAAGRHVPLQVQVTMETTGRMLVGSEIGAALVTIAAMKPDVLGINCATGPAEMQEHLRYLSRHSPLPISVLPNAGLPSIVDGRTHYDLTPEQLAEFHRRHVAELGISVVGGCCGTTPEHLRQVVEAVRDLEPAPPLTGLRAERVVDLQPGDDRAGPQLPHHRRAHQRQRLEGVPRRDARRRLGHLHEDGQRAGPRGRPRPRRVRRLRRPRRRRRHGRDRQALRHPGERAAGDRLDRDAGARGRAAAHRRPGDPQLGQPRGRRAARQPLRPGDVARPRVRRGGHLPAHRRAWAGSRRRVEDGDRPPHPRDRHASATGCRRAT